MKGDKTKSKHEMKTCPRCGQVFECRVGDILKCQCYGFSFTEEERKKLASHYIDCICRNCLVKIKDGFNDEKF